MYKIMLVDDEPIVRLAIKSLINWEENGFEMDFEASNGKQALKLLESNPDIDIMITDINMPVMDGLELISQMSGMGLAPEIIVLSSYNDYDWVRKAFKLGVNDYILKTEMEPLGILELVNGMADKIDSKKRNSQNKDSVNTYMNGRYQKESMLQELLSGGDISLLHINDSNSILKLNRNKIALCYLWVDDYQTVKEKYINNSLKAFTQAVVNSIDQILADTNSGEVLCISPEEYIIFMAFDELSQKQIRYKITDVIGRIQYSLKTYVNITAAVGISDVRSMKDEIGTLLEQAKQNVKLRFILGKGKIIFPETADVVMWKNKENSESADQKKESIIGREDGFLDALSDADEERASIELEKLFDIIRNNTGNKIERIYSSYMELLFVTTSYLSKIGKETQQIFGTEVDFYEKILRFETQEEINIWIKNMVSWIINYLKESKSSKQSRVIANAKHFIHTNYSNTSISLKMVSDYVELSESHFSTTFTRDVGETFTDYLTNVRLEKAKELITTTNLKLYEISEHVGYINAEHFSRIFKKNVGCSPKDYLKKR